MEQPAIPNATPQKPDNKNKAKRKIPTAQELISHYQTQGLDSQEASIKVIEDLQNVAMRVVSSNSKPKKDKLFIDASRKIDSVNSRLAVVDMKLDTKPGYLETFAIGVASGAAFNGISSVWPHVFEGFAQIWKMLVFGCFLKSDFSSFDKSGYRIGLFIYCVDLAKFIQVYP